MPLTFPSHAAAILPLLHLGGRAGASRSEADTSRRRRIDLSPADAR